MKSFSLWYCGHVLERGCSGKLAMGQSISYVPVVCSFRCYKQEMSKITPRDLVTLLYMINFTYVPILMFYYCCYMYTYILVPFHTVGHSCVVDWEKGSFGIERSKFNYGMQ